LRPLSSVKRFGESIAVAALLLACGHVNCSGKTSEAAKGAVTTVNISGTVSHAISPYIYGFGTYLERDRDKDDVWVFNPTLYRWGGNTSTRFNWQINAWNTGKDWYFMNVGAPWPNAIDYFMAQNQKAGVASSITIPILGWVAKDTSSVSFPTSLHPKQQQIEGQAGNGVSLDGSYLKADPKATSVEITPEFIKGWVNHLKSRFGSHPHFYIMDNEPMLWHQTHRDVLPEPMTYDGYLKRYLAAAIAVRQADPDAVIIGPATWGWLDLHYSAFDLKGTWNNFVEGTDRAKHGGKPFLEWFIGEVKKKEAELKVSLLDILDGHHYPEGDALHNGDPKDPANRRLRLQSTKSLWDRNYVDQSWINEKIYYIPRMKDIIARTNPTLRLSIGEYNYRAEGDIAGVIAQAEALGIFAAEDLYMAQYWTDPPAGTIVGYAFRLFRNYDGAKAAFGDQFIKNDHGTRDDASVYASKDAKSGKTTVIVLNKSTDREQEFVINLPETALMPGSVTWYRYDQADLTNIQRTALKAGRSATIRAKPLSMHLVEFK
jgi:hypothetical protein